MLGYTAEAWVELRASSGGRGWWVVVKACDDAPKR